MSIYFSTKKYENILATSYEIGKKLFHCFPKGIEKLQNFLKLKRNCIYLILIKYFYKISAGQDGICICL